MKKYKLLAACISWPLIILLICMVIFVIICTAPVLAWLSLCGPLLIATNAVMPAYFNNNERLIKREVRHLLWSMAFTGVLVVISIVEYFIGFDPTGIIYKITHIN